MNTLEENQEGTYQGELFSPGDAERVKTKTTKITVVSPLLRPRYGCHSNGTEATQHLQSGEGVSTGTPGTQEAGDTADHKPPQIRTLREHASKPRALCSLWCVAAFALQLQKDTLTCISLRNLSHSVGLREKKLRIS